jgi:regulator of replication initiation timing
MCKACKDKIAALEQLAADRLEMIGGLGGDISRMQQIIGTLQTENTRIRQRLIDSIEHSQKIADAAKAEEAV